MSDLIDRQSVINAIRHYIDDDKQWNNSVLISIADGYKGAIKIIEELPSEELIRCEDCKWWDKDDGSPYGYCLAMKHGYISTNWEIGIYRRYKGDFYCADAEREEEDE